jgi:hypothetical protein
VNDGRDGRGVDVDVDADDGHGRADGDGGDAAGGDGGNGDVLPRRWRRATAAQTHEATLRGGRRGAAQYFWESTHVETLFHLTLKIDLVSPCFFALFDWVTQRRRIYILLHTTPQERGFCASKY